MQNPTPCPVCTAERCAHDYTGKAHRAGWQDGKDWSVWRCPDCEHGFMHPQPGPDVLSHYYSKGYAPYSASHGVSDEMAEVIKMAKHSQKYRHVSITPGMRLLDVGCGGGSFLKIAREMGAQVQGVEPSEHGVAICEAEGLPVFHGTLTEFLKTSPGSFDLITANHVVEHHPDPVAFLAEIKTLLDLQGSIWIALPNAGSFFSRQLRDLWHSADLPVHLHHFTARSLETAFMQAGLKVDTLRSESENSLPGSLALLLRRRAFIPGRITLALTRGILSKTGALGRRMDAAGQGEALLVQARL